MSCVLNIHGSVYASLKVNSVDSCHTKQRAVLEGVRGESVVRCIPKTTAADLHALSCELADVNQGDDLISGDHEILYTGSYHLREAIQTMNLDTAESLRLY